MKTSVIRRVGMLVLALLMVASLVPMQAQSPQSQAIDGRAVVNNDVLNWVAYADKRLTSQYDEAVRQWVANKQQLPAGAKLPPIPVPPTSWIVVPHAYTAQEKLYDASYPGIAPLIDDSQTGPPVEPQYVEPTAPPKPASGTVVNIGPFLRTEVQNGKMVSLYAALPDDNMPAGFLMPGPGGQFLRKFVNATPWGTAQWYQTLN
jgi:hypothetical protein